MDQKSLDFYLDKLDKGEEVRLYEEEEEKYFRDYLMEHQMGGGLDVWYEFDCVVFQRL